ncbi:MAG: hypothetical protein QM538_07635 [Methylacidiphilales bacterium]|nr:hypothetical protein [Candidatus Methylacidiphilales bacterium]
MDNALINFILEAARDNFAVALLFAYTMYRMKLLEVSHTSLENKIDELIKGFKGVANDIHAIKVDIARIYERQDSMHVRVHLLEDVIIRKRKTKLALPPDTAHLLKAHK